MTKPVLDLPMVARELEQQMGKISSLSPVAEGEESRAFSFQRGDEHFIVRVNHTAEGFKKDAFVFRQFATDGLPIPEIVLIDALSDGHAYCVSRRVPGDTLQALSPPALHRVLEPVARIMDEIAAAEMAGTSGYGFFNAEGVGRDACWRDFLTHITAPEHYDWDGICHQIDIAACTELAALVVKLAEHCPEERHLVHGDFGSNNVITAEGQITGVIDWSEALFGDPLYDIANIFFWRPWLDCMESQANFFEKEQPDRLEQRERLRCYQVRIGLELIFQAASEKDDKMVRWATSRCQDIAFPSRNA